MQTRHRPLRHNSPRGLFNSIGPQNYATPRTCGDITEPFGRIGQTMSHDAPEAHSQSELRFSSAKYC
jgi:hypothetical protein